MRVVFAGTPAVAVETLLQLIRAGHEIALVISRPDAPLGRKRVLTPSAVSAYALENDLPLLRATSFTADVLARLEAASAEVGVVVAYGGLIPQAGLSALRHGWFNLHFSALPDLRGAAPVQRSIMRQDISTATTVFQLVRDLDAGPIASQQDVSILPDETSVELLTRLSISGAHQMSQTLSDLAAGRMVLTEQAGEATYAHKLTTDEGELLATETGNESYARFRGVTNDPGAWFWDGDNRVKVLEARLSDQRVSPGAVALIDKNALLGTATTALQLLRVQPAGKQPMPGADWARGRRVGTE